MSVRMVTYILAAQGLMHTWGVGPRRLRSANAVTQHSRRPPFVNHNTAPTPWPALSSSPPHLRARILGGGSGHD
ncbi:hypothetical protein FKP32DRAFT_1352606 [Trametes sanguinea]|nr:hypothetical protein FKP32DRAFT_1352606 [Trametes sanguinea]